MVLLRIAKINIKMKKNSLGITAILTLVTVLSFAQKTISEGTISYTISMQSASKEPLTSSLGGAAVTVYLKGAMSRTDMVSNLGNEKTIYDAKAGGAVILKEYSGQKLMITLTKDNWNTKNKKTEGITFTVTNESKQIAGYACTKATAKLNDGSTLNVFYTKDVTVLNKDYDPAFKNLPGLPVQYEFESATTKFIYTLSKIDLNAVPAAKFDTPKTGYRVMTYDEANKGK